MVDKDSQIVIAGAGSIGCYAGGCLALAGRKVRFLCRPNIEAKLRAGGLRVSDLDGRNRLLDAGVVHGTTDPAEALTDANVVLVTVKSGATEEMAELIAAHARSDAVVVSLQNGVDNVGRLTAQLGSRWVLAGMVAFNVVQKNNGKPVHVHRATEGAALIENVVPGLAELLDVDGFAVRTHADMRAVLWGKLLFNLNNALVALSGLPLATELADRRWRLILARQIDEALAVLKAASIKPGRIGGLRPALLPKILRLPDWLFRLVARRMLMVDPEARASMWDDLERGRPTEIDEFQGKIMQLAQETGTPAPLTARIMALVETAEAAEAGSPQLSPEQVLDGIGR
ncbi:2-dehydropantoate 2-reductase [Pseudaminobacter soli (ex Li et al. 2025)]|uniref:2-dehydropantoate 2-reductase n=1 Tax=Pseudaminobacter soli (ex Li et al. 2025) TaxID=1295366 RepID=A0A2P7S5X4_9HYPH|nr:2-dehydropantoate 2-reductase [Mesorhizobium soli]PSJ57850.1 2-dehydropantoate 2-reductase [Mesorhizobium soli]